MAKLKRLVRYPLVFPQAEWVYSRKGVPKYLDAYGDSDWAGDEEGKRSTTGLKQIFGRHPARRCVGDAIAGHAVQRRRRFCALQPRDRRQNATRVTS